MAEYDEEKKLGRMPEARLLPHLGVGGECRPDSRRWDELALNLDPLVSEPRSFLPVPGSSL